MKKPSRLIIVVLALLLLYQPFSWVSAQQEGLQVRITQVDASSFPRVTVYVSVVDESGEPVPVNPNRLQLFENGQAVEPIRVSASGDTGPLTTMLVMDISGSMYDLGKLIAAQSAARAYVDQMRPGDQAGLLAFNTETHYLQPVTGDHQALLEAIDSLDARGDTSMYDALLFAADALSRVSGRKAIIVLTDGLDNRSRHRLGDVIAATEDGGLSLSTIGLGDPEKLGINSGLDEAVLKSLAEKAGGAYGYANNPDDLTNLYEKYGRALQSEYSLTFESLSGLRDGLNRSLAVSLDGGAASSARYNPGGVLPEVSKVTSWWIFFAVLAVLVTLIFIPGLVRWSLGRSKAKDKESAVKPRIKLK
jgi:VWFA-related protein